MTPLDVLKLVAFIDDHTEGETGLQLDYRLHYQGSNMALLDVLVECARKGLTLNKAEDLATVQEALDRAQASQGGGSR